MNQRICLYVPPLREINSYYQFIDFAVENNIKYIETINQYELAKPNIDEAKKLKLYADKKGVSFQCVSLCIDLVGENREENLNIAKQYVDVASVLGAKYLHHTIAMECTNPNRISSNFDLFYKQGIQSVREVYDYANKIGVRTVYEDQGYLFNGLKTFRTFLNEVNRNVGVVADFGNIMFVEEKIDDFIYEFSDKIVNVHVKDYAFSSTNDNIDNNHMFVTKYGTI